VIKRNEKDNTRKVEIVRKETTETFLLSPLEEIRK